MKPSFAHHLRLLWVFVALLAYGSQSFAMLSVMLPSAPSTATDLVMTHCHDDTQVSHSDFDGDELKHGKDCCDGGCSMLGCHATSAMVSSVAPPQFDAQSFALHWFQVQTLSNPLSAIYHPPIFS